MGGTTSGDVTAAGGVGDTGEASAATGVVMAGGVGGTGDATVCVCVWHGQLASLGPGALQQRA
eukprot:815999-Alexandrium_andersonii.AAC.1